MLRILLGRALIVAAFQAQTKEKIVVAVLDSGISNELSQHNMLCKSGHKDFTTFYTDKKGKTYRWTGYGLEDKHGHGTHISGIIDQHVKGLVFTQPDQIWKKGYLRAVEKNYCQVILKWYHNSNGINDTSIGLKHALRYAIYDLKANVINLSGGGEDYDEDERKLIIAGLARGIKIVVAAGNNSHHLGAIHQQVQVKYSKGYEWIDKYQYNKWIDSGFKVKAKQIKGTNKLVTRSRVSRYYPAMYSAKLVVVGNLNANGTRSDSSNYGTVVNAWEIGEDVLSFSPVVNSSFVSLSGTSQATAVRTGKIVKSLLQP